jgi:hypothetical protein
MFFLSEILMGNGNERKFVYMYLGLVLSAMLLDGKKKKSIVDEYFCLSHPSVDLILT